MRVLFLLLRLSIPVGVGFLLSRWFGPWSALGTAALLAVVLSSIGILVLQRSKVGQMTWHNHLAGWLLPWGYGLARGKLVGIGAVSAVVFTAIAGAVILVTTMTARAPAAVPVATGATPAAALSWLLVVAWMVDGAALLHLVSVLSKSSAGSSSARTLWKLSAVLMALLGGSIALLLAGHPSAALWVAGGPPLVIGVCYGLFVLLMVTVGRNARWN